MSYTGISTRERKLETLLNDVLGQDGPQGTLSAGLKMLIRRTLDAKCGIHVYPEAETLQRGGVQQGKTYPCELPAGHSGQCYARG